MTATDPQNHLIIGPSWVGDMVISQSLLIRLKQQRPACRITVMAPAWSRSLLAHMPEVDDSILLEIDHGELRFGRRRRIGKSLQPRGFTSAFVLPNSFKSALIPFHAGIPRRIGWRGEWRRPLLTHCGQLDKSLHPTMAQRFAALADLEIGGSAATRHVEAPRPRLVVSRQRALDTLAPFALHSAGRILAICPGAEFGAAKQWPAAHYGVLANTMIGRGWQVWLFGSDKERDVADAIQAQLSSAHAGRCANLIGKTTLAQAIHLISLATLVVSNDSGLMHVAAALDKPVVAIYGSTSPGFTPPLAARVKSLAIDIECSPCFQPQCPYGHLRCLTGLKPQLAIDAIDHLAAGVVSGAG